MTAGQFAALVEPAHMRGGPAQEAVRLVLVEGFALADAARQAGVSTQAASNALQRARRVAQLAALVAGVDANG